MTGRVIAQCALCRHYRSPLDTGLDAVTCAAFRKRIPAEIWSNRADHRRPFAGDHGIRWEPDGDAEFPDWAMEAS